MKKRSLLILLLALTVLTSCGKREGPSVSPSNVSNLNIPQPEIEFVDAEEYYKENGELIDSFAIRKADAMLSESEVCAMLKERGFTDLTITTNIDEKGRIIDPIGISEKSDTKHPVYETDYFTPDGMPWIITVISDKITANPVYYNFQSGKTPMIIIEDENVTSYDYDSKKFYVTVPSESALITRRVERIDAETLATMTVEELSK